MGMDEMGSSASSREAHDSSPHAPGAAPLQLPPPPNGSLAARDAIPSYKIRVGNLKRKTHDEASPILPPGKRKKPQQALAALEMPSTNEPIDLSDIKEWIAEYEASPQPSALLTPAQRKALQDFKASIAKVAPVPEIIDEDWISALQLYRDIDSSRRRGVDFTWDDVTVGSSPSQFQCFCSFKGPLAPERMTFPREDCGFVAIDTKGTLGPPSFPKKKDARRYAAQYCIIWLLRQGEVVKFPRSGEQPRAKSLKELGVVDRRPASAASAASSCSADASASPALKAVKGDVVVPVPAAAAGPVEKEAVVHVKIENDAVDDEDPSEADGEEDIPATKRVTDLCQTLGFVAPQYRITPADTGPSGFYNGYAYFGVDHLRVPDGLGYVTDCCGKEATKQRSAEQVLKWLLREQEKRAQQFADLEAEMNGGVKVA
ncbi:hypothetical protein B0T16DRAFT_458483 [Cercophora newfieldiana]|uniref:Uncharacterized protein n=1 Tax=Cercophora newfieldiana TaxID=92897 RepID=A0AA40CRK9_9PEZI|nr:hypothetical protein B0T16DRAFT_458483 [Cercophora newfieldiana]